MIRPIASVPPKHPVDPALRKAAQGFEAMLLRQLLAEMRQGKLADDVLGSSATDTYRDLSDQHMADALSVSGALGIAAMVQAQFHKNEPNK